MGILDFNAYNLEYLQRAEGYYDELGGYHKPTGEDVWVSLGRCNAVPAGKHNVISLPDGSMETYSFTIILHNPRCREFKYGETIRLTTVFGMEKVELTVLGFARYQHMAKLWG